MTDPTRTLTIAEAAAATGLTPHTLRYDERDGLLLDAVERASSGHRRCTDRDLAWLHLLTRLRSTGMPIREIERKIDVDAGRLGSGQPVPEAVAAG